MKPEIRAARADEMEEFGRVVSAGLPQIFVPPAMRDFLLSLLVA